MFKLTPIVLLLGLTAPSSVAHALDTDRPMSDNHIQGVRFDVHADFGGYGSLGAGMRIDIPLVRNGFLTNVDDELALSPGFDVFFAHAWHDYYDGGAYFIPSCVLQWNFYLWEDWSIFPEAGLAFYVGDSHHLRNDHDHGYYAVAALGFGARYHFSPRNSLLMRVSTPTGLQVGLTF